MKSIKYLAKLLALFIIGFSTVACGNDSAFDENSNTNQQERGKLSISVNIPSKSGIIMKSRATVESESDEVAIDFLDIYIFKKDGSTGTDNDYKYFAKYPFGTRLGDEKMIDGTNGDKLCYIDIPNELTNSEIKAAVVANDMLTKELSAGTSTLSYFLDAYSSAEVNAYDLCDKLVGDANKKSFPMACVCDPVILTMAGAKIDATLIRNVARLDIFNDTPNLTITSVAIDYVNDKSLIFPQSEVTDPQGASKISLFPLNEFTLKDTGNGISYIQPAEKTEKASRLVNTHRVAYLYEQKVENEDASPMITIGYELIVEDEVKFGSIVMRFKKDDVFVNVDRNTLYRIRLGNGHVVGTTQVSAVFEVIDWYAGEDLYSDFNPEDDQPVSSFNNDYTRAKLGDVMLVDGGKGMIVSPEEFKELDPRIQAKAIGVVAFLYESHPASLRDGGKSIVGENAKGLVMALKNASTGVKWKTSDTSTGTLYSTFKSVYETGADGYTNTLLLNNAAHPAAQAARNYNVETPTNTTGWYLPSEGEWIDILSSNGIGNIAEVEQVKTYNSASPLKLDGTGSEVVTNLNTYLGVVGDGNYDKFVNENKECNYFWSSSECSSSYTYRVDFDSDGFGFYNQRSRTQSLAARSILAF